MTPAWDGAQAPELAPLSWFDRAWLILRAPFAAGTLAFLFAIFLVARVADRVLERIALKPLTRLGPRVVQAWAALALPTLGLRFEMLGQPMRRPGAYVANHSSWIDIVALQRAGAPFLVSKSEVRDWPGIGLVGRAIGTMFIDRTPTASEARAQQAELVARLARGDHMAIFPEGTSTDGQQLLPFKSPLFAVFFVPRPATPLAVQPVTITYHPRPGLPATFYNWWGGMAFAPHLVGLLARSRGGRVQLRFHDPIPLARVRDRKALAKAAEYAVREGFDAARRGAGT